jgi:2-dehydro-3-deoxyphosphogluconate aldolase/(4S)-4-hydroxy-2-oxoglutarate aldolase
MSVAESPIRALLRHAPVIPVYTPASVEEAVQVASALVRGGLPVIEVTLRTPAALDAIRAIARDVPGAIVGAGTVLDAAQVEAVRAAGAAFGVSPGATPRLLAAVRDHALPFLPGIATASELMAGLEAGLDTFKFFPAVPAGGVAMLSSFAGPFPQVKFCPTGGISPATAPDFLAQPNVICIGGSWLTPRGLLEQRDWPAVEHLARATAALRA